MAGSPPARTPIVIVALDEASVRELGQWPFTRATYARLIDRVSAGAPLAIGLDLIFDTPSVLGAFYRVVRGEVGDDVFRGKIVLVGATGALFHDSSRTAFAHAGGMPGVEFLANLIETLAVGNRIREVPAPLGAVVALLAGVALGVVARRRPGLALPVAAGVMVVIGGVTYAVFVLFDVWCRAAGPELALELALVFILVAARGSTPAAER